MVASPLYGLFRGLTQQGGADVVMRSGIIWSGSLSVSYEGQVIGSAWFANPRVIYHLFEGNVT